MSNPLLEVISFLKTNIAPNTLPIIIDTINPPMLPSQVFLGDILGASLCLPKNIPIK
jgi:hypothetical protein